MGSLPNLRETGRDTEDNQFIGQRIPRNRLHLTLSSRTSGIHRTLKHTRSMGNYNGISLNTGGKWSHFFTTEDIFECSPSPARSTRFSCSIHHRRNVGSSARTSKSRDSMASSGGTSSVRKLIDVVRSTPSKTGPIYSRRLLLKNFAALCLGHAMITAALIPMIILQGSISVWWNTYDTLPFQPNFDAGSLLLAGFFGLGSLSTLYSIFLVNRFGTNWILIFSYGATCIFIGLHFYPSVYTLIPAYFILGAWFGPLILSRITVLMTLANKLSLVTTEEEEGEIEGAQCLRRTEVVVHKLARELLVSQDFGCFIGNLITALVIWYTAGTDHEPMLNAMFPFHKNGERVCGSEVCPISNQEDLSFDSIKYDLSMNNGTSTFESEIFSCKTTSTLTSVFLGLSVMGAAVTLALMNKIRVSNTKEKNIRDAFCSSYKVIKSAFCDPKLQMVAPLSLYIGLQQGFMYSDFAKTYIACGAGIISIVLANLSLGVLQSIAAFTLSLLLQHVRRHAIISVGFIFQSCLCLILFLWKPSKDDPALFYVVPAAWGVCHAIWDSLNFTIVVSIYSKHWQAPFAHCYFFRYLGLSFAFGIHTCFCNRTKLWLLLAAMIFSILPYTWLELRREAKRKQETQMANL